MLKNITELEALRILGTSYKLAPVGEYEGTETTCKYMRQKYHKTEDIAVKEILSLLMEVLEAKYAKMRIFLKK